MTLRGSVETIGLVDLLQLIQGNGHSGTLKVVAGDITSKLYFYKGQIYLPTGGAGGALKIGALLVRARKITGRDLLRALALQNAAGGGGERLGEVLVREGLIKKDDLDGVVRRLYEEEIHDLLFREGAYFEWKRDVLPAGFADARGNIRAMNFDTRSILMEASRRQDEWHRIRARLPSTKAVYRLSRAGEPKPEESEDVIETLVPGTEHLPPDEQMAARAVDALRKAGAVLDGGCPFDGRRNLEDVVALTNLTPFEALGTIARLRDEGVVRPIAAPEIEPLALAAASDDGEIADAYKLYAWTNEVERLRRIGSSLDRVLLAPEVLRRAGRPAVAGRTGGARALTILSRLLRRGAPFHLHAREEESAIDVYVTARVLRLHLMGPRRVHSATRYLRARGEITDETLKRARDLARKTGRDLDRVLLEEKIVSRDAWLLAVKDKVVSALFSIFEWPEPYVEVSAEPQIPPAGEEPRGLVVEIPLDEDLREDVRKDLLRWKAILEAVPSPDVIFTCERPTPAGELKRTHDLLDGRRNVADLLALAKVAPLELVRFLLEALLDRRIRRLTDREHQERIEAAEKAKRLDDAVAYAKSAIAFGFSSDAYRRKLVELREKRKGMPSAEGRPTVQGELGQVSLAEVLQLLHGGKRTGTLRITSSEKEKTLYFDQGELYVLSVEGPAPAVDVQELLGESAEERLGLSGILAKHGQLREDELSKAELDRVKEDLFEAFLWEGARFEFLQNFLPPELRTPAPNTTKLALKTQALLFEAMQRLAEWDDMRKLLRSSHAVFRFATSDAKADAISGENGALAYLFDGELSLAEVVRRSGEDRYRVYRFASELVRKSALVFSHQKHSTGGLGDTPTRRIVASGRFQKIAPEAPSAVRRPPPPGRPARGFPGLSSVIDSDETDDSMHELERSPAAPPEGPSASRRWGEAPSGDRPKGERPRVPLASDSQAGSQPPAPPRKRKVPLTQLSDDEVPTPLPDPEPEAPRKRRAQTTQILDEGVPPAAVVPTALDLPRVPRKSGSKHEALKSSGGSKALRKSGKHDAKPPSSSKKSSREGPALPKKPPSPEGGSRKWGAPPRS